MSARRWLIIATLVISAWGTIHGVLVHDTADTPPGISSTISPSGGVFLDNLSGIEITVPPRAPQEIVGATLAALILVALLVGGIRGITKRA